MKDVQFCKDLPTVMMDRFQGWAAVGAAVGFQEVFHPLPVGFLPGRLNAQNEARKGNSRERAPNECAGSEVVGFGQLGITVEVDLSVGLEFWVGVTKHFKFRADNPYLPAVGIAFLLEFQHATSTHNRWHASAGMKMMGWSVSLYHIYQFWEGNLLHSLTHQ